MFIQEYFAVIDNHLYFNSNIKIFGIYVLEWIVLKNLELQVRLG